MAILTACLAVSCGSGRASPTTPTQASDYLTQMICIDRNDKPLPADPVACPASRRKLRIGEALPYHKVDFTRGQISDSYPISGADGISRAVQTYFYVSDLTTNPLFPDMVHFNPENGGYNILGADEANVYFRGTFDQGGGWQPWWTADCRAAGWLLFPAGQKAFTPGAKPSPTQNAANCRGRIDAVASTVEWFHAPQQRYETGKVLDTLRVAHFAPGYASAEFNYFTREYGVTRWEAWRQGTGETSEVVRLQCPNGPHDLTLHGKPFYMADCHDWSVVMPLAKPWDPDGRSPIDPRAPIWPVDPLYTSSNRLQDGYLSSQADGACNILAWRMSPNLRLRWLDKAPWSGNGNCTAVISAMSGAGSESLSQIITPRPDDMRLSYGSMLWTTGGVARVAIKLTELDPGGRAIASSISQVAATERPQMFTGQLQLSGRASALRYEIVPLTARIGVAVTGSYVAGG
ncbi:hypothetical protein [Brevundimonas vesicularis]|uniref:hypothetical protein n=1 Tax=Brevundimonas vesicularis TaxID=41276 RepID=UPI00384C3612